MPKVRLLHELEIRGEIDQAEALTQTRDAFTRLAQGEEPPRQDGEPGS